VRKLIAVLLAVMVLAVIGSFTGYFLGLRELNLRDQAGQSPGSGETGDTASASATASGTACLDFTEREVKKRFKSPGNLVQVLYVRTSGSEVWICKDSFGNNFYQGHRLSQAESNGGTREAFTDSNNLLLQTVSQQPDGSWVATNSDGNGTTRYRVSTTNLVIELPSGTQQTEKVTRHEP
jgi:hypothetical protein